MPKTTVAMIAQHPANLPINVIMVNHKRLLRATNHTFVRGRFDIRQLFITNGIAKFSAIVGASVLRTTSTAPTIQPVPFFIVRREEFNGSGFAGFATSTSQQFHARSALFIREFGSRAVSGDVFFFLCPFILAQKESRLGPPSGCGGFSPGLPGLARL